jgi:glyoxylase-like metal-dependent hydrolase (beta-lactamase superfamily II)
VSEAAEPSEHTEPSGRTEPHWTEPGAHAVAPGVHRIPLPLPNDGLRAVNVYLLDAAEGPSLIDAGWATGEARRALGRALHDLALQVSDIRRILVTHIHRDHYTQAMTVRRESGAVVGLGEGERESLEALNDPAHEQRQADLLDEAGAPALAAQWRAMFGNRVRDLSLWEQPDTWLRGGPVTLGERTLEAIETPGHTRGHLVFADVDGGLIFAGDHVLPTITPSIGFEPVPSPLPLADYLESLARMRALPDLRLLPAHGPVTDSLHRRVDDLLIHHAERLERFRLATAGRVASAYDVAVDVPWTRRSHRLGTLDPYNAALAVLETRAHLEVLVARGDVRRVGGEVAGYQGVEET